MKTGVTSTGARIYERFFGRRRPRRKRKGPAPGETLCVVVRRSYGASPVSTTQSTNTARPSTGLKMKRSRAQTVPFGLASVAA